MHELLHIIIPWTCLACRRAIAPSGAVMGLCEECARRLQPAVGPQCRRCALPLPGANGDRLCGTCLQRPERWRRLLAGWLYREPLDAVIGAVKFARLASIATEAGLRLGRRFGGALRGEADTVTAVPLHWHRRWRRGFDQAELIGRAAARELSLPYRRLLRRVRATPPQARRSRRERLQGLHRAFAVLRPEETAGRHLILVDDVVTTCATIDGAARALNRCRPASITVLAVARTPLARVPAAGRSN